MFLDCTLRDGGYYNSWCFPRELTLDYLEAMESCGVDIVELGLRSLRNTGFGGANAYTTEEYLTSLPLPKSLSVAVMINASELVDCSSQEDVLDKLFPEHSQNSSVDLVRIACHIHEFKKALPAANLLDKKGFRVGFNLMQIADRSQEEVEELALEATHYPIEVLYFADSMGSMSPSRVAQMVRWLRKHWKGALGIHTHDNLGLALQNTLRALDEGVSWVDATVTGMGRGPGNARTEELVIELAERSGKSLNLIPLMRLVEEHFKPLQRHHGWGTNPYYYLAGKYGIHPTYIQEMLNDSRYDEEDLLAVIEHLRVEGGKKFSLNTLGAAREFYQGKPIGSWNPFELLKGREVLLLGTGPGVREHRLAIENYVRRYKPLVIALNTQTEMTSELIDLRVACHPVRLLADCEAHTRLPQPLITPASMLPEDVKESLGTKELYDFGIRVEADTFEFGPTHCTLPTSLVIAYALAIVTSGRAQRILMAGFDGYSADDPRSVEMQKILGLYQDQSMAIPTLAITPTRYALPVMSIHAM